MKYRHIIFIAAIISAFSSFAATPYNSSAAEVLRKASSALKKAPSIEASFTASQGTHSSTGKIIMSGDKFFLTTPQMSTWFDGRTQWAYSPSAGEVNISEPMPEELRQINPFAIIDGLQADFSPRRLKSPSGFDKLELTPKRINEYTKILVTFNSTTHFPTEIILTATDRSVTTIKITSIRQGKALKADSFRFNAKNYPGVEIVDLR